MITKIHVITWLELAAAKMQENKTLLTGLDSEIGDADHGINMERGFKKVLSQLPTVTGKDIGTILKTTGMALISSVGGASGPLYGTFFLDASKVTNGKEELNGGDLILLLVNGINGIKRIGKANPGDKTLVDTFEPALKALQIALTEGDSLLQALEKMSQAAKSGMENTIPMIARKGRASYLGERSIGHQDPGATSAFFLLDSLFKSVQTQG
jgi:phosphoenolpyruvate---glycerone phosphotransferase subunit DhaL